MYDRNGDHLDPADVLDQSELSDYTRRRSEEAHYRLARYARTGRLPVALRDVTEEAAVTAYEDFVTGASA